MAQKSYRVRVETDWISNYVPLVTSFTEHPYPNHVADLAIFNQADSNVHIYIHKIWVKPLGTFDQLLPTKMSISRITSQPTGGEKVIAIKLDSSSDSIPSQIDIKKKSIASAGSVLRSFSLYPRQNMNRANQAICSQTFGHPTINSSVVFSTGFRDNSVTQGFVIREGQGLSVTCDSIAKTMKFDLQVTFTLSGGKTYVVSTLVNPTSIESLLTLWNGIGSGEVITVVNMELSEVGEDLYPKFNIYKIDGLNGGTDITPIPFDSLNGPISPKVLIRQNSVVSLFGSINGAIISNPIFSSVMGENSITSLTITNTMFRDFNGFALNKTSHPIKLNYNEGIAVMIGNSSGIGHYEIFADITKQDLPRGEFSFGSAGG